MSSVERPEVAPGGYKMNWLAKSISGTALVGVTVAEVAMLTGKISPNAMLGVGVITVAAVGGSAYIDERARRRNVVAVAEAPTVDQPPAEVTELPFRDPILLANQKNHQGEEYDAPTTNGDLVWGVDLAVTPIEPDAL